MTGCKSIQYGIFDVSVDDHIGREVRRGLYPTWLNTQLDGMFQRIPPTIDYIGLEVDC